MKRFKAVDLQKLLAETVKMFSAARVPYMIIGAVAVDVFGRPRTTLDLDFAALAGGNKLKTLRKTAAEYGYAVERGWEKQNPMAKDMQLRLSKYGVTVDILLPRNAHDVQALSRKRKKKLDRRNFHIISPDDLILQKLKVGRPKDFEDALSVLIRSKKSIDFGYLRRWAAKLGITEELDYILNAGRP